MCSAVERGRDKGKEGKGRGLQAGQLVVDKHDRGKGRVGICLLAVVYVLPVVVVHRSSAESRRASSTTLQYYLL